MTDFLTRLVERTLGVADTARPDLGSLASVALAHVGREAPAHDEVLPSDVALAPWHAADVPPVSGARRRARAAGHPDGEAIGVNVPHSDRAVVSPPGAMSTGPEVPTEVRPRVVDHSFGAAPIPRSQLTDVPAVMAPTIERRSSPRSVSVDRHHPVETAEGVGRRAGGRDEGPTINITIGRIDVRSARAVTRENAPPTPSAPQQLRSLETYLRERNGIRP